MASQGEFLLGCLQDLGKEELQHFQWFLRQSDVVDGFSAIPKSQLEEASRHETVDRMLQTYGLPGALQITVEILKKIGRNDLVKCFPQSGLEPNKNTTDGGQTLEKTGGSCVQEAFFPNPPNPEAWTEDVFVQRQKASLFIASFQRMLQSNLHNKYMCVPEGLSKQKDKKHLDHIYTELYITDGTDVGLSGQHEISHIEMTSKRAEGTERSIQHNDIFKHSTGEKTPVRTVLTYGIAGIGKTILVYKFILDWAEGRANQDVHLVFPLTFRHLNLLKGRKFRFADLIHKCIRESRDIEEKVLNGIFRELQASGNTNYDKSKFKLLFVLDGLDESRLQLDFNHKDDCSIDEPLSVGELLSCLIKGKLLPSARVWVTTRPAAAGQIPLDYVDIITEVRGFTDPQKEEYFRKRFPDEQMADKVISHMKASRSLHIMCHIPVFCWITATVLRQMSDEEIPQTLTEMYSKFLVFQIKQTALKYDTKRNTKMIHSLTKIAFHQLEKGNIIFYEKDLKKSGIHLSEASLYSGVFTQIFKEDEEMNGEKLFCFVHLSIQEFLAAVFVILSLLNDGKDVMTQPQTPRQHLKTLFRKATTTKVCMKAVDKALQSQSGHLDLFVRFLLGLSLKSNQHLLQGLLKQTGNGTEASDELVMYIKQKIRENLSPERCINLFCCLGEMKDSSLVEEIQLFLGTESISTAHFSPSQWSAMVYVLLSSEKHLDVFVLKKYSQSEEVLLRMLPLVKASTTSLLDQCELTHVCCKALASLISYQSSSLRELDLSYNNLQDVGVELLCVGLKSRSCRLETLRLCGCELTEEGCSSLASALSFNSSHQTEEISRSPSAKNRGKFRSSKAPAPPMGVPEGLYSSHQKKSVRCCNNVGTCSLRELDLSSNNLQDSGMTRLSMGMESPHCGLESLRLSFCNLTKSSCQNLVFLLGSRMCCLKRLDLSNNHLEDSGVALLSDGLDSPYCKLETLSLSGCLITMEGCISLEFALKSDPSRLRELDLSYNHPGESGVKLLSAALRPDVLRHDHCGENRIVPGPRKYACELTLDPNTANQSIVLSRNYTHAMTVQAKQAYPEHSDRFRFLYQVLCTNALTGRCYWEVEWRGVVYVGVAYRGIVRNGREDDSLLGWNDKSWCLCCNKGNVWHNGKGAFPSRQPPRPLHRVAVYLDWPAGTLSFYSVYNEALVHIYTFHCSFTHPLYPALRVVGTNSFASLC